MIVLVVVCRGRRRRHSGRGGYECLNFPRRGSLVRNLHFIAANPSIHGHSGFDRSACPGHPPAVQRERQAGGHCESESPRWRCR
jgi:hypothetical protein